MKSSLKFISFWMASAALFSGCSPSGATFSLLASQANFQQNAETKGKIDILWVVDNSGSMASSQQNLTDNIQRFVEIFNARGFDYQMAVTTSDAYKELFGAGQAKSQFRDGTDATSHTGIYLVNQSTPNLETVFAINALQGINGSGDERAFQSFKQALENPLNAGFPRKDAFLAVIILSDEDDFSTDGAASIAGDYANAGLHTVDSYVAYLDELTGASAANRSQKYSVNSITILDQQCLDELNALSPGRRIGTRYVDIAEATGGMTSSLCGDFAASLSDLSYFILNAVTEFFLDDEADVDTLKVAIEGVNVPRVYSTSGDGFMYHADRNSITFHGDYQPGPSDKITVDYDPTSIQ